MFRAFFLVSATALSLAAAGGPSCAADPWTAQSTTPVSATSVVFANGDARLRGTLYAPAGRGKFPAIVVFHSGAAPLGSAALYRHLRDGLPQLGIAVLLFDRRGTGASKGSGKVSYETLTDDGIAGARTLRGMPQIDPRRVGYWGIAQGGRLATIAAVRDPAASFAIAVSAALVTPEAQMEFAMANRLHLLGYGSGDVAAMLHARALWRGYLLGKNSRSAAVAALQAILARTWFRLMHQPSPRALTRDPATSWRNRMDDDPLPWIRRVRIPMLFILGARDPFVPVSPTVARVRDVSRVHPSVGYAVVPNANHLMMYPAAHETMNEAGAAQAASAPQSPAYFMTLAAWLERTLLL